MAKSPVKALQAGIDAAQAAMVDNVRRLRLGSSETMTRDQLLRMLIVSLIEWCDHHGVDFDCAVSEVRAEYAAADQRKENTND